MKVGRLMTRVVKTCRPQDSLSIAAKLMWDSNCGSVAVVADTGLYDIQVSIAMSKKLFSCGPEDSLATAEKIMRSNRIRRLPVVDADGHLVGILSLDDIAREAAHERKGKGRAEITTEEVCDTLAAICGDSRPGAAIPV
jgi:CBS domain-containing protein